LDRVYAFLHLFTAFGFVGSLVVAEWNGRAARMTSDWGQRAALFEVVARSARMGGLVMLLLLGVFGNLSAVTRDYRMSTDSWLRWANGVWLAEVLILAMVCIPAATRLATLARSASAGGGAEAWDATLKRWRLANLLASLLYLFLLALMVFRWRN
jgi:Na+/melibiose symporter-like transporter